MRRTKYPIHKDFKRIEKINPPLKGVLLPIMQKLFSVLFYLQRSNKRVKTERKTLVFSNRQKLRALVYTPKGIDKNASCLVYYHGGGFVIPAAPYHYKNARNYAIEANCKVIFANYRLAPKYPYPAPLNDCLNAYIWVLKNAKELGINEEKIAIGGDSAGACLAAAVSRLAHDKGLKSPCAQLLIYPVVGIRMQTESMRKYHDTPMCNNKDVDRYCKLFLQGNEDEYSAPINAPDFTVFPPTYLETAEFDCLRDEGILFAEKLQNAGVPVFLHNTQGTMHAYDMVQNSEIVRESMQKRVKFLIENMQ